MKTAGEVIFWMCVVAVGYAYAVYPALIFGLSRAFGRRLTPPDVCDSNLPTVALLIAAHSEEAVDRTKDRQRTGVRLSEGSTSDCHCVRRERRPHG